MEGFYPALIPRFKIGVSYPNKEKALNLENMCGQGLILKVVLYWVGMFGSTICQGLFES